MKNPFLTGVRPLQRVRRAISNPGLWTGKEIPHLRGPPPLQATGARPLHLPRDKWAGGGLGGWGQESHFPGGRGGTLAGGGEWRSHPQRRDSHGRGPPDTGGGGSGSCHPSGAAPSPRPSAPAPLSHRILISQTQRGRLLHLGRANFRGACRASPPARLPGGTPRPRAPAPRTHQDHRAAHYLRHALPQLGRGARLTQRPRELPSLRRGGEQRQLRHPRRRRRRRRATSRGPAGPRRRVMDA